MAGMNSIWGKDHLERSDIWSSQLKEALMDDLQSQQWVNWLTEFPDGAQFNIASVGELSVDQLTEDVPLPDRRPDTGQFNFAINQAVGTKAYYTDKFMEDDFLAPQVVNATPVKMKRALDEYVETEILKLHREQPDGLDDANIINGAKHRYIGSGTGGRITPEDFAYAKYALRKANVPLTNLVAIVDPATAFQLETLPNLVNVSSNPQWEGIITSGITTGMRFIRNIYGFDVYESTFLDTLTTTNLKDYSGNGSVVTDGAVNLFFSAADKATISPFMGAWRRMPNVVSWRDEGLRREYYQLTARFGLKLYRPENLVSVVTNTDV